MFMMSSGGLTAAELFQGKDAILSGPAGGVVGMAETGREAGFEQLIGFDMGGTSTDVSHFDGEYERAFETEVAGVRMRAPMMLIHTVAAGGGSILHFDGARFRVGPDSAGANPGPTCYRRGGPLAVTDANVMVGKLIPDFFPKIFGPDAGPAARRRRGAQAFAELAKEVGGKSPEEIADGFIKIAVENMANAIKKISVQRGYDVTRYALNCFGGAGGQHACLVADALGMTKVLIHPFSSLLSAYGMGLADIRATRQQAIEENARRQGARRAQARGRRGSARTPRPRSPARACRAAKIKVHRARAYPLRRHRHARWWSRPARSPKMKSAFEKAHKARFGFIDRSQAARGRGGLGRSGRRRRQVPRARSTRPTRAQAPLARPHARNSSPTAQWHEAAVYTRDQLAPGHKVAGPRHRHRAAPDRRGRGRLARRRSPPRTISCSSASWRCSAPSAIGTKADPVMLEVFNNLFMSIAEQMGVSLQNTAYSVNIKERLDFSCAVFAADGTLVANAPHMPVHLGSMDRAVETIIRENKGKIRPGDVYLHQRALQRRHAPARHHRLHAGVRRGQAARSCSGSRSRGHHADIGGIAPGSMSPIATIDRGGRRLHRQLQAGRSRQVPRGGALRPAHQGANIRRATRCRTSTT